MGQKVEKKIETHKKVRISHIYHEKKILLGLYSFNGTCHAHAFKVLNVEEAANHESKTNNDDVVDVVYTF